jgi:hypothetical protein
VVFVWGGFTVGRASAADTLGIVVENGTVVEHAFVPPDPAPTWSVDGDLDTCDGMPTASSNCAADSVQATVTSGAVTIASSAPATGGGGFDIEATGGAPAAGDLLHFFVNGVDRESVPFNAVPAISFDGCGQSGLTIGALYRFSAQVFTTGGKADDFSEPAAGTYHLAPANPPGEPHVADAVGEIDTNEPDGSTVRQLIGSTLVTHCAPPPPPAPPLPAAVSAPALGKKGARLSKRGSLPLRLTSDQSVTGTATGSIRLPKPHPRLVHFKVDHIALSAGELTTVTLKLSSKKALAAVRKALKHHKLKLSITVQVQNGTTGAHTVKKLTATLKR